MQQTTDMYWIHRPLLSDIGTGGLKLHLSLNLKHHHSAHPPPDPELAMALQLVVLHSAHSFGPGQRNQARL